MSATFADLAVRASGLRTHLFDRAELARLAHAPDLAAIAAAIRARPHFVGSFEQATLWELERAVRRGAAQLLAKLARWAGPRQRALSIIYEDEDRRSIRAIAGGIVEGATQETRLAALLPTSSLPQRALEELAEQPDLRRLAARLVLFQSPFAADVLEQAARAHPDLYTFDAALDRTLMARAAHSARRGDAHLVRFVSTLIDLKNAYTVLVAKVDDERPFLRGGSLLDEETFASIARATDRSARLSAIFAKIGLRDDFAANSPTSLEHRALSVLLRAEQRAVRLEPVSTSAILLFWLRLRACVLDLSRITNGVAFGAPRSSLIEELVTP